MVQKVLFGVWRWKWILIGALYGVLMRIAFVLPKLFGSSVELMSVAFLVVTPFVVGALSVYGLREEKPSFSQMFAAPSICMALMLGGCAVSLLEGAICIAIMAPLFIVLAIIGGVCMGLFLRYRHPSTTEMSAVVLLPLLVALPESRVHLSDAQQEIQQSVDIKASPQRIWNEILTARNIQKSELPFCIAHVIGVPKPIEGVNIELHNGAETRFSKWERGVSFQGIVDKRVENSTITWHYKFDSHSFPSGSMDEHVEIGGRYFDLEDTTFNLIPLRDGETRLQIIAHYRVTSSVNFYALPVAHMLGTGFVQSILGLYKNRSEQTSPQPIGG